MARASKRGRAAAGWFSSASAEAICSWTRGSPGKRASSRFQTCEGLVVLLGPLVDAAECLEDVEQVGAGGLSREGAFESQGGVFGLADQDEGLAEIVGGQGIARGGVSSAFLSAVTAAASWPR